MPISKLLLSLTVIFQFNFAQAEDAFELYGTVGSERPQCHGKPITLWLSQGKQLLFQSIVPVDGSYSYYVRPGTYNLIATSEKDCFEAKIITVTDDHVEQNFGLQPSQIARTTVDQKTGRMPASMYYGSTPPPNFHNHDGIYRGGRGVGGGRYGGGTNYGIHGSRYPYFNNRHGTEGHFCPACRLYQSPMPYNNYWMGRQYGNFGRLMYSNHSFPCAWQGIGCAGRQYPPGGPLIMGKPNVYFENVPKGGATVGIKLPNKSRMIATVPTHQKSWKISPAENGNIQIAGVNYPYIHYDFRAYLKDMQNTAGFCTNPTDLIPRLKMILEDFKFTASSIDDFTDYFNQKVPPDSGYCVFPQLETEIQSISKLDIEPEPEHLLRINFIVVPENTRRLTSTKFNNKPTRLWKPAKQPEREGFTVKEWGMGFLVGEKSKPKRKYQ